MMRKQLNWILPVGLAVILTACGNNGDANSDDQSDMDHDEMEMDHGDMDHSSSGEIPGGLQDADNPTYEVGGQAIITDGHMEGMEGSEATIVGAYDTVAYSVSYTPTTGGERVEDHKWVIQEEIEENSQEPFEPGSEVTLEADHMEGMDGATATIDSLDQTTVYMIDYTSTNGDEITNHKWVTEDELSPVE